MVVVKNPEEYTLKGFRKSNTKNKKYDALLINKKTKRTKTVPFGDNRYEHYEDKTDIKLYDNLNHYDKQRRSNYRKRHKTTSKNKFSSSYFAYKYLW